MCFALYKILKIEFCLKLSEIRVLQHKKGTPHFGNARVRRILQLLFPESIEKKKRGDRLIKNKILNLHILDSPTKGQTTKGQTTKGQNDKNIFLFES